MCESGDPTFHPLLCTIAHESIEVGSWRDKIPELRRILLGNRNLISGETLKVPHYTENGTIATRRLPAKDNARDTDNMSDGRMERAGYPQKRPNQVDKMVPADT